MKYAGAASLSDVQKCNTSMTTPIRLNKTKFSTPSSIQRRALGLVNYNSNQTSYGVSNDDLSVLPNKSDESVILPAPAPKTASAHPEDDLPHISKHRSTETFDDLIPNDERIERLVHQTNGVNIFAFSGGIENTIRCQSPQCSRVDLSTLLDILN